MELDLKLLFQHLAQVPDEPAVSSEGVSPYLLEHVLTPALNGRTVPISGIDFDAFEENDIETLADYYDRLVSAERKMTGFVSGLSKTVPAAGAVRAFC